MPQAFAYNTIPWRQIRLALCVETNMQVFFNDDPVAVPKECSLEKLVSELTPRHRKTGSGGKPNHCSTLPVDKFRLV